LNTKQRETVALEEAAEKTGGPSFEKPKSFPYRFGLYHKLKRNINLLASTSVLILSAFGS
jgi:hypothetical protein